RLRRRDASHPTRRCDRARLRGDGCARCTAQTRARRARDRRRGRRRQACRRPRHAWARREQARKLCDACSRASARRVILEAAREGAARDLIESLLLPASLENAVTERRQVDLLITDGTVITVDDGRRVIERGAVAIDGNRIVGVGPTSEIVATLTARKTID